MKNKIGFGPEGLVYSEGRFFVASDRLLKNVKRGQRTGLDSNHLLLSEWFRKGPADLQGLEDYVPAYLLANGMEHQGTFHGGNTLLTGVFNEAMRREGLFQKSAYTRKDIERGMEVAEEFLRNNPGGDLGGAWSEAIQAFRDEIYSKL